MNSNLNLKMTRSHNMLNIRSTYLLSVHNVATLNILLCGAKEMNVIFICITSSAVQCLHISMLHWRKTLWFSITMIRPSYERVTRGPMSQRPTCSKLVLCEYSKFRIEYFSIRFHSKRVQLFEIFEYLPSPISYLNSLRKLLF